MAKNVSGEGTRPRKLKNGTWRAELTVGFDGTGKQKQKYVYGKTERECQQKLNALKKQRDEGSLSFEKSMTLSAYYDHWLEVKKRETSKRTIEEYGYTVRHVLPRIGKHKLDKLTPLHVQRMQLDIATVKTPATAARARALVFNMLDDALKLGLVYRNVAAAVDPVKVQRQKYQIWTAHEIIQFLAHAQLSPYYPLYYLGLTVGMRPGELIALHKTDVEGRTITVSRSVSLERGKPVLGLTKNRRVRVLTMPEDTERVLLEHADLTDSPLVFPARGGDFVRHGNIRRSLESWAKAAEVPIIRPHDLRHTYASMCIASGTDAAQLARDLGHADPSFTYSRYVHFFERYQPREARTLNQLLGV